MTFPNYDLQSNIYNPKMGFVPKITSRSKADHRQLMTFKSDCNWTTCDLLQLMSHMITFLGVGPCELCQSHRGGEWKIFLNGRNKDPDTGRRRGGQSRMTLAGQADWLDSCKKCTLVNLKVRYSITEINQSRTWITELFCTGALYSNRFGTKITEAVVAENSLF